VVEVVFEEVVFGEVGDVAGLDLGEVVEAGGWIGEVRGVEGEDVDHFLPPIVPRTGIWEGENEGRFRALVLSWLRMSLEGD
jgi:hypothetical protein